MPINVVYKTSATAHGGRDGESKTDDGSIAVKLAVPKEMGGPGGGNNPEQLFATGYAACFLGAMKFVASENKELPRVPNDAAVQATVGIGPLAPAFGFGLDIELKITLPGVDHAAAEKLVHEAHRACPYSNATRNNVDVRLVIA